MQVVSGQDVRLLTSLLMSCGRALTSACVRWESEIERVG